VDDIRREHLRRLIRDSFGDDRMRFCRVAKKSKARVYQLLDPRQRFGDNAARHIVEALGLTDGYFERPLELEEPPATNSREALTFVGDPPTGGGVVARVVIQPDVRLRASHSWQSLVTSIPQSFSVALPDAAMSPDLPPGSVISFKAASEAQSGMGVLVRDREGTLYFREYRARTRSQWQAVARNAAFLPLDSSDDGLTVVAVMVRREVEGSML
jgi:hypothetical protein